MSTAGAASIIHRWVRIGGVMRTSGKFIAGTIAALIFASACFAAAPAQPIEQLTLLGRFDLRRPDRFFVSPDANRVAWRSRAGGRQVLVVDGAVGQPFDVVDDPLFSPDGSRVLYVGHLGAEAHLFLDGKIGPGYREIHDAEFSPDSRHVTYVARTGADEETLFLDDVPKGHYRYVRRPTFSPDSSSVVYDGNKGNEAQHVLVRNGTESPEGGEVSDIVFSPDGQHLAAVRHRSGRELAIMFDGT